MTDTTMNTYKTKTMTSIGALRAEDVGVEPVADGQGFGRRRAQALHREGV